MRALNMGRPSIEDIKDYGQHIVQKTYLWTDGLQSYSVLSTEKQCTIKQMKAQAFAYNILHPADTK